MNHWNLFKESWRIFWRNPALWVFGLLAALGGGFNLRYNFNFNFNANTISIPSSCGASARMASRCPKCRLSSARCSIRSSAARRLAYIVVIGIVWTIIAFLLATYADGALMGMVNTIGGGQKVSVGVRLPRRSEALPAAAGRALCAGAARVDSWARSAPSC